MRSMKSTAPSKADDDTLRKLAKDDDEEGGEQHDRIPVGGPQKRHEGRFLDHVPGDDRKHAGERGERYIARKRSGEEHEQQKKGGMKNAGNGARRAGTHIRGGAGNRPGYADAPEERRADIRGSLRDQFHAGAVPAPGHAVGNDGGEKRFDGAEEREGNGIRKDGSGLFERERRQGG